MSKEQSSKVATVARPYIDSKLEIGSDRAFGFVFAGFFCILSVMPLLKGHNFRWPMLYIALVFAVIGSVLPRLLHPLNIAWMKVGAIMQKIVSPIILIFIFYFVVTPVAILMRLLGAKAMVLSLDQNASTYWVKRDADLLLNSMKNIF